MIKRVTPHSLRPTSASYKAQSGVSPFELKEWQWQARELSAGDTLVVVPANNPRLEQAVQRMKITRSKRGRPVIITKVR